MKDRSEHITDNVKKDKEEIPLEKKWINTHEIEI